jgi:benzoyl-CoA-dihydrodiol lyase
MTRIDFQTDPSRYRHWKLRLDGAVAHLVMDVDPGAGLFEGYELKLNSYDLGVDIELADAVQRLRFEHPEVGAVVIRSAKENVFCAGANIRMLGKASHGHKVNFCKFTNETRCAIEDATEHSGQRYLCAVNGTAAGGGYELAVATDHILLIDDRRSTVSLPETPLLAVLPGTGGLTRVTDKRKVRRDLADVFCSTEEGVRGRRAVEWRLVDEAVPPSAWEKRVEERAAAIAARSDRPRDAKGVALFPAPAAARPRRWTPRATPRSGRSRWRGSWTTPSCTSGSTSRNSACWCCAPRATPRRCWRTTPSWKSTSTIGSSARRGCS